MDTIQVITGPTAVGKTAYAIDFALAHDGEIVSADSRQVFRELNIGTAKPEPSELAAVPHHFIDERHLGEPFSAGIFAREAEDRIADILSRGKTPVVAGGSTLYLRALMEGLADIPPVIPEVRSRLLGRLENEGKHVLYDELMLCDPDFAATLDATKTQRLIRGLEVFLGTGKPISAYHKEQKPTKYSYQVIVLERARPELYRRIESRVDLMLEAGLVNEVKTILGAGFDPKLNALRTIGYQEPVALLQGLIDENEMVRLIKRNSRRYAKRQMTWFRQFTRRIPMKN